MHNDCDTVLRFFGWLADVKGINVDRLAGVFSSQQLGALVEGYVRQLVSDGKSYGTAANYVSSLLNVARFVLAARKARSQPGPPVSTLPVDQLVALQRQCKQQRRQDDKYHASRTGAKLNWLDWCVSTSSYPHPHLLNHPHLLLQGLCPACSRRRRRGVYARARYRRR